MSLNYAKPKALDLKTNVVVDSPSPFKALAQYSSNNATASSVITLTDNTTIVEIAANGSPVAVRWVPASEGAGGAPFASVITTPGATANFDHIIPKDTFRRFVVPIESQGVSSIVGINVKSGLYKRVALMSGAAVSSILTMEF